MIASVNKLIENHCNGVQILPTDNQSCLMYKFICIWMSDEVRDQCTFSYSINIRKSVIIFVTENQAALLSRKFIVLDSIPSEYVHHSSALWPSRNSIPQNSLKYFVFCGVHFKDYGNVLLQWIAIKCITASGV